MSLLTEILRTDGKLLESIKSTNGTNKFTSSDISKNIARSNSKLNQEHDMFNMNSIDKALHDTTDESNNATVDSFTVSRSKILNNSCTEDGFMSRRASSARRLSSPTRLSRTPSDQGNSKIGRSAKKIHLNHTETLCKDTDIVSYTKINSLVKGLKISSSVSDVRRISI